MECVVKYPAAISFKGVTALSANAAIRLGVPVATLMSIQTLANEPSAPRGQGGGSK